MAGRVEVHLAPQGRETLASYRPPAKRNRRHRSVSYWRKLAARVDNACNVREAPLRERADHLPVLILREGSKRLDADVAERADRKRSLRDGLVVGRLEDDDRVVLAHRQIEVLELGAEPLERLPGRVQACGAILDGLETLLGETSEKYVWVWIL